MLLRYGALLLFAIVVFGKNLNSQNLVPNSGFEQFTNCPTSNGQIYYAPGWRDAHGYTTDYFNSCNTGWGSTPSNGFGFQTPYDGVAYIGFRATLGGDPNYFEFPAVTLWAPLNPCQFYRVSYKVSRSANPLEGNNEALDKLGVAFFDWPLSNSEFDWELWSPQSTFTPSFTNPAGNYITDTSSWTTISGTYLAHGGEWYMVLGNFERGNTNPIWMGDGPYAGCYYYIDDVHIEAVTTPILGADFSLCSGESVTLETNIVDSVLWSDGSRGRDLTINSAGIYWVNVWNRTCFYSDTVVVTEAEYPDFSLGNDTVLCEGEPFMIGASVSGTYNWNSGSSNQNINVDTSGNYILTVTENGCATTDDINLSFEDCIFIPNAFSPNNDGQNDVLYVRGYESGYFHFAVFDRWGTMVFETTDPAIGWDGIVNHEPGIEGVYTYYAELDSRSRGGRYIKKGNVTLLR